MASFQESKKNNKQPRYQEDANKLLCTEFNIRIINSLLSVCAFNHLLYLSVPNESGISERVGSYVQGLTKSQHFTKIESSKFLDPNCFRI